MTKTIKIKTVYIGHNVYAQVDNESVILMTKTNDGHRIAQRIILDFDIWESLVNLVSSERAANIENQMTEKSERSLSPEWIRENALKNLEDFKNKRLKQK